MIEDDVYAENLHEFIKALCGGALEERIGLALVAHAVDDVAALHIFFDEAVDDVNVILQVGIHADGAVAQRHGGHEAGEQGVLVAAVVRELYAVHIGNRFSIFGDNRPGFILAAVIDIENAAFGIDLLGADHGVHFFAYVKADAYDDMIYNVRIADQSEKSKYLSYVQEQALYYRELNISVEDENVRIVALSTCNSQTTNGRDVLIGVISDETYPDTFVEGETEKQQGIARNLLEQIPLWWYGLLESVLIGLEIVAILRYIRKKHKNCMAVNNRAVQGQKGGEINDKKPENGKYKK